MEYNIPVVFAWLGKEMPSRYKKRLEWIKFPYILLN
jgi:hypothetical protein